MKLLISTGPNVEFTITRMDINFLEFLRMKLGIAQCPEAFINLQPGTRAYQCAGDGRLPEHPGDRHLREALTAFLSDRIERAHAGEIAFAEHRLVERPILKGA